MAYFNNTISIANLTKPTGQRPPQYKYEDEDKYYGAYLARLEVARALGTAQLYFDGIHYLHVASECFLKYLFCLVRHEIFVLQPPSTTLENIPHDYDTAFLFAKNKYAARSFDHNLSNIVKFLNKFSDAYSNYPEFQKYIRNLRSDGNWIHTRYESVHQTHYQADYNQYLSDFDAVLNGGFRSIK